MPYVYVPGGAGAPAVGQPYIYQPTGPQDALGQLRAQQYQQAAGMAQAAQQAPGGAILWVQGEEGAKAYMVAPGASVMLMDSESQAFYIKTADASGMPLPLRAFDYVERTPAGNPAMPQAAVGGHQSAPAAPEGNYATKAELDEIRAAVSALQASQAPARETVRMDRVDRRKEQDHGKEPAV